MTFCAKYRAALFFILFSFIYMSVVFAAEFTVFTGQVDADEINVRVDSTVSSKVACTLARGELVEVVSEAYDWYKIRLPKTAPSYIKTDLLECISKTSDGCSNAKVTGDKVNIRLGPNESSWILGQVDKATVVNIIQDEGSWSKIEPVHQSYGWVNKKFINKEIVVFEKSSSAAESQCSDLKLSAPEAAEKIVVEGTVSPYGVVLWRKATHKLVTADKKTYFLKGNRKGLNSLNHREIKVTGKIINPENSKYPLIEADVIEVLN
jgi:uncharacterized protein YgiM (DUF1202 family)